MRQLECQPRLALEAAEAPTLNKLPIAFFATSVIRDAAMSRPRLTMAACRSKFCVGSKADASALRNDDPMNELRDSAVFLAKFSPIVANALFWSANSCAPSVKPWLKEPLSRIPARRSSSAARAFAASRRARSRILA
jgi:hypothetical protein